MHRRKCDVSLRSSNAECHLSPLICSPVYRRHLLYSLFAEKVITWARIQRFHCEKKAQVNHYDFNIALGYGAVVSVVPRVMLSLICLLSRFAAFARKRKYASLTLQEAEKLHDLPRPMLHFSSHHHSRSASSCAASKQSLAFNEVSFSFTINITFTVHKY